MSLDYQINLGKGGTLQTVFCYLVFLQDYKNQVCTKVNLGT